MRKKILMNILKIYCLIGDWTKDEKIWLKSKTWTRVFLNGLNLYTVL
jgi:hypothetical protein